MLEAAGAGGGEGAIAGSTGSGALRGVGRIAVRPPRSEARCGGGSEGSVTLVGEGEVGATGTAVVMAGVAAKGSACDGAT
jgi:hypothetical protein